MRIAIDISQLGRDKAGVNYYTTELVRNLVAQSQHQFVLYTRSAVTLDFLLPANSQVVIIPPVSRFLGGGFTWYWKLGRDLRSKKVDWLISATLSTAPLFFARTLCIVHDLVPITMPEVSDWGTRMRYKLFLRLNLMFAGKIAAVSDFTRSEITRIFPGYTKPVTVTGEGVHSWLKSALAKDSPPPLHVNGRYILTVGTIQPRKNHEMMIKAFARLRNSQPDLQFVIVGKQGWGGVDLSALAAANALGEEVKILGAVNEEVLASLYYHASSFVMMSKAEGFGLPLIEARSFGLPCVVSDIPVFREIKTAGHVYLADPEQLSEIVDALNMALADSDRTPDSVVLASYDWAHTAQSVLTLLAA